MHRNVFRTCLIFSLIFFTSSCAWIPNPFASGKNLQSEEGSCRMEGYLFLKGKVPNALPVLQNDTGQWYLTGQLPKKMKKIQRKKVRVEGECPEAPEGEAWLLPEFRVFRLTVLEDD